VRTPKVYSAFTASIFLHVLIIAAFILIAKQVSSKKIHVPYIVSIVESSAAPETQSEQAPADKAETKNPPAAKQETKPEDKKTPKKPVNDKRVKDQIAALQAKKKIENIAALRKIIDVGGQKQEAKPQTQQTTAGSISSKTQGPAGGDYYSKVVNKIRENWVFPESADKELEAIIAIKISRDGTVTIEKIEKGSGNALFDRSVLRAINKASPLPPPQNEIEMGVRFRP
jgi:TonB family protein